MVMIQVALFWVMTLYSDNDRIPCFGGPCWRWRQLGPLNYWYLTTSLHGVTTQKTMHWLFFTWMFSYP